MGERGGGGGVAGNCFPDPVEVDGSGREGEVALGSRWKRLIWGRLDGNEPRNAENIPETAAQMPCYSHCQFATRARLVGGRVPSRRTERAVTASPDRKGKENLDPPIHPRAGAAEVPRI
jgi:hypothetical protein